MNPADRECNEVKEKVGYVWNPYRENENQILDPVKFP